MKNLPIIFLISRKARDFFVYPPNLKNLKIIFYWGKQKISLFIQQIWNLKYDKLCLVYHYIYNPSEKFANNFLIQRKARDFLLYLANLKYDKLCHVFITINPSREKFAYSANLKYDKFQHWWKIYQYLFNIEESKRFLRLSSKFEINFVAFITMIWWKILFNRKARDFFVHPPNLKYDMNTRSVPSNVINEKEGIFD